MPTNREALEAGLTGAASPGPGHDFSRIPIHPPAGGADVPLKKLASNHPNSVTARDRHTAGDHSPPFRVEPSELRARVGEGTVLPPTLATDLSAEIGYDLRRVRVHADARGDFIARALGAQALAFGEHIAVRQDRFHPETRSGRELVRHEARHIAVGAEQASRVQLKIEPEDISAEMHGMVFILRSAQGSIAKGERVVVVDWRGTDSKAYVRYDDGTGVMQALTVPKLALEPDTPSAPGLRRYDAGLGDQQTAVEKRSRTVEKRQQEVKKLQGEESKYKTKHKTWEAEMKQAEAEVQEQEKLLAGAQTALNRVLIQQTMYNRFDPIIAKWVDFYNKQLKPKTPCDPNLVKSMMFKETRLGTNAKELSAGPATDWSNPNIPFHSHFNVLMNIQSSGEQQMMMLKEMAPDIFSKHHLDEFEKQQQPKEWNDTVIWGNPEFRAAVKEMFQKRDASRHNALGSRDVDLQLDYEFWIRTGIRWLFFKYFFIKQASWKEAAHAYNGLTTKGEAYAKDVMSRVGSTKPLDVSNQ